MLDTGTNPSAFNRKTGKNLSLTFNNLLNIRLDKVSSAFNDLEKVKPSAFTAFNNGLDTVF